MKNQPLVSIVIPAFNRADTLRETLDSCLNQTYPNCEIVVVNDGSTDETREIVLSYGERLSLIDQPNKGLAEARNTGHEVSRGEYIAWMDADDIAMPERVAIEVAALESLPEVALVSSDFSAFRTGEPDFDFSHSAAYYKAFAAAGGVRGIFDKKLSLKALGRTDDVAATVWYGDAFPKLLNGNFVHPPTVMLRRSAMKNAGNFNSGFAASSDYEYILRVANASLLAFVDRPLLRYRRSEHQMSGQFADGEMPREFRRILETWQETQSANTKEGRRRFNQAIAESYVWEAQYFATTDRRRAVKLLLRALSRAILFKESMRTLALMLLPKGVRSKLGSITRHLCGRS